MKLKETIENHPVLWLLGSLLTGFLAGISTYQAILYMAQLETVRKDSYVKIEEFRSLKNSIDTLSFNVQCEPLLVDYENTKYESSEKKYSFTFRFLNTTANKMNCLIRVKSGYCSEKSDTESWTVPIDGFTLRETKEYSFIVEGLSSYNLKGTIEKFPDNISENSSLFYEIVKTEKLE